jgi:hypothetical protein
MAFEEHIVRTVMVNVEAAGMCWDIRGGALTLVVPARFLCFYVVTSGAL